MLVTFQTDAYESITLFGDVAKTLLGMMGHSGKVPGAILANDVAAAVKLLRQNIEFEKRHAQPGAALNSDKDDEQEVSLPLRAVPLIALLQAASDKHCDVLWT